MAYLRISEFRNSSVLRIYAEREHIQIDPDYQRMGNIWGLENRQLLIDTILNDFDVPKLYFHEITERSEAIGDSGYAVIDGRQRLESIWSFIDGEFALAPDFRLFNDPSVFAGDMTYSDIAREYPLLKTKFDSYVLPIITITTDDLELIEELFLRLNDAVPLNAAEKRNAIGGTMARIIREVSDHQFFLTKIPFNNKRYQHREVAAKFLLLSNADSILDTKKAYLDNFVRQFRDSSYETASTELVGEVVPLLTTMFDVFVDKDPLMRTQAMVVIYFLAFKTAVSEGWLDKIQRIELLRFDALRSQNRVTAADDISGASYALLEFDRMHLQGSNDRVSIDFRLSVIKHFLQTNPTLQQLSNWFPER